MSRRKQARAVATPLDDIRPEAAGLVPAEHAELAAAVRVEDADRRVPARGCESRAVRTEHRAVDDAQAVGDAVLVPEREELLASLRVEDPDASVRAGGCDPRAVGTDVHADDRVRGRSVFGALVETDQLLARVNTPHPHGPGAARARHEPAAVRRERTR